MDIEKMEPEMLLESDRNKGLTQPGLAQGLTYVDCNGNIRRKYETLETITSTTAKQLKDELDEVQAPEVKDEVVKTSVEPVAEDTSYEEPKDPVEKPVVKEEPKPVAKKAAPKKAPVKKAPVKK